MHGIITDITLFDEINTLLFIISVYDGTQLVARVPLVRENVKMGEFDKEALIKTAIDIAKYRTNANRYYSQSEVANEFQDYWWSE